MAVNTLNIQGGAGQYTGGDGIDVTGGVITNTMSPASVVLDNSIGNPATVTDFGGAYIVPTSGLSGAFSGQANKIAISSDGGVTWGFSTPTTGMRRQVTGGPNAGATYRWSGSAWVLAVTTAPVGSVLKVTAYNGAELVLSGSSTNYTLTVPNYTPVSTSSTLIITFDLDYLIGGYGSEEWRARLNVAGAQQMDKRQRFAANVGGGTRSSTLAPITARYTNSSAAAKAINLNIDRIAGDDAITIYTYRNCTITEVQR